MHRRKILCTPTGTEIEAVLNSEPCSNPQRVPKEWKLHYRLLALIRDIDGVGIEHSHLHLLNLVKTFAINERGQTEVDELGHPVVNEQRICKFGYDPILKRAIQIYLR